MYSIAKFASRTGRLGHPLESPFSVFDAENVRFRFGATSMIAGKPGAFKSVLALNLLARWAQAGHTAMYFSADSDEFTVGRRLAGILTGTDSQKVDADFLGGNYAAYMPSLRSLNENVRFVYQAVDLEGVASLLNALEQPLGGYPDVIFIDNLINFAPTTDDWGYMRDMTNELDQLAREIKSHICVLHHASEGWGTAADPVPRAAIQGKITQIPRLVLTCAANEKQLAVVCVKNTNGPQYPDATRFMGFSVEDSLQVIDNYEGML